MKGIVWVGVLVFVILGTYAHENLQNEENEVEVISIDSSNLRLIQLSQTERRWVTMEELLSLRSSGVHMFDITDHPNLGPQEGMWEPVVPPCCSNQPEVRYLSSFLSTENLFSTVQTLSSYYTRYYQSDSGVSASEWIYQTCLNYVEEAGLSNYVEVSFFNHTWAQPSVIARIPGTSLADQIVILGAHLDSIISDQREEPPFPRSPGANDDASGCANVLEVFRVLLEHEYVGKRTIEFHFYSAEEVGLRGSQDIATNYQSLGTKVAGMLQLDMTGFPNMTSPQLRMINDYNNEQLMTFLKEVATTYSKISWFNSECGYACSDHASWNMTGFYSCRVRENGNYVDIHTINDVISNIWFPYSLEFAKVALGYLIELSTNVAETYYYEN